MTTRSHHNFRARRCQDWRTRAKKADTLADYLAGFVVLCICMYGLAYLAGGGL